MNRLFHGFRPKPLLAEIPDHIGYPMELCLGELGINWQAEALARRFFGHGKIAWLIIEMGESFLQVKRHRVMHAAPDLTGFEESLQFVAARKAHDI